jgi:hypothetical protein
MHNATIGIAHVSVMLVFVLTAIEMFVTHAVLSTTMIPLAPMVMIVRITTAWSAVILYEYDTSVHGDSLIVELNPLLRVVIALILLMINLFDM